ncbi:MAG: response regulator transcription factor [Desulfoplanes sp.]|jgi:two-component system phosphate regulon response regulator PhoB|nr:response regulator transcription factor [Desulfoplanes sp.]
MRILIVEDEPDILNLLAFNLENSGFEVIKAEDGYKALEKVRRESPDLVLLDLMLPKMDGLSVCRRIKENPGTRHLPVLMLTAKGEEADKITGLELGADDYVTKPFSPRELILRIKAVLRRAKPARKEATEWKHKGVYINFETYEFRINGEKEELTATEFRLIKELIDNQGRPLTREHLLSKVWGYEFDGYARTVDTHVRRLRKKMGPCAELIETVRGIGYRMN